MSKKIKIGDNVIVISGKDKGKSGEVFVIDRKNFKVKVRGINVVKKHKKPSQDQPGGIEQIETFINISNVSYSTFNVEYIVASNLTRDDLSKLTTQEMFDAAYLLYGYSTYIQDEINKNKVALSWCEDQIEKLVAANLNNFDQYTKHDVKRQIIIRENSYAASVDQMRLIAESRLQSLEGKTYELKRQGDILLERAKRLWIQKI